MKRERIARSRIARAMTTSAFYREEAERCRRMAATSRERAAAKRWRVLADDYLMLALSLDENVTHRPAPDGDPAHPA